MARLARSTILGFPHHVIQRGNYDQPVFETDADYRRYLSWLQEYAAHYAVDVWAYCLMPNHVHFVCVPNAEDALARAFNTLHMRYAQYFNGKRSLRGHLWRARFMSCVLDESSVREEVRFVENNPVRVKLVGHPNASVSSEGLIEFVVAILDRVGGDRLILQLCVVVEICGEDVTSRQVRSRN